MSSSITSTILRHFSYLPGWRTNRKIIVFESDDWGSIRMPSRNSFEALTANGVDLTHGDSERYNLYDTLASKDDLISLFEVLDSVKDKNSNSAVFTALSLVANPDFEKISASGFEQYFYEPFSQTLKRYGREDAFQLWHEGNQKRLFVPQFHGREHLNVQAWMRALQKRDKHTLLAFEHGMWAIKNKANISYQAAFDLEFSEDIRHQETVLSEGLDLFEKLHHLKASFFVPPNGYFKRQLESVTNEYDIKFISTSKIQLEPQGAGRYKKRYYWLGKKNKHNQLYLTRNAIFEPSKIGINWVNSCLNDINLAFKYRKPATISTHRVNYIGAIDPSNRDRNLKLLKELLLRIIHVWPDVEFMTSPELGTLIESNNANDISKI